MGCDIHTMAEVLVTPRKWDNEARTYVTGKPHWEAVRKDVFTSPYYREGEPVVNEYGEVTNSPYTSTPYQGRNYRLFSVLADVRNDRSLHNMFDPSMQYAMRDAIEPISDPRGVPEDASERWLKYVEGWGADLHSTSYFTLTELIEAEKAGAFRQPFTNRGYIPADQYRLLEAFGTKPTSWVGYASGGIAEADYLIMSPNEQATYEGYITAEWPDQLDLSEFVDHTIPNLMRLAPFVGPHPGWPAIQANGGVDPRPRGTDKVRLVFGFDN